MDGFAYTVGGFPPEMKGQSSLTVTETAIRRASMKSYMNRRQFLATPVVAGIGVVLAGCLGDDGYEKYEVGGQEVPLAPVEEAYEWYQDGALFLDATNEQQHQQARIEGSRLSPPGAPNFNHPIDDVDPDERIVTYCVCPHQLAGARAAELMNEGFENVYAIDEGLQGWQDEGYPMASGASSVDPSSYTVSGRTDPAAAGEQVWLEEPETAQQYVTQVESDGFFELSFDFFGVDDDTLVVLDLPGRTVERTLGELSERELQF